MGHFTEVHDISDPHYRQLVVNTLGINLWGDWEAGQQDQPGSKVQSTNIGYTIIGRKALQVVK